jgi:ankyrin repeat protein
MFAANLGDATAVEYLLSQRANVNWFSHAGITPLMDAARRGHPKVAVLLLQHGADVNAQMPHDGLTPLMHAAMNGHWQVVEVLLHARADVNVRAVDGITALSVATAGRHEAIAERLRAAGATE